MTDLSPESGSDDFDAEVNAAREAEHEDAHDAGAQPQERDEGAPEQPQERQQGLSQEELDKRYRSSRQALNQERTARRDLERQLQELRQRIDKPQDQQHQTNEPPLPSEDPIGFMEWQRQQELDRNQRDSQRQQSEAQERQAQERVNRIADWGREQENDFREDNPDYDQAAQHFAAARVKELAEEGYKPGDLQNALMGELLTLTQRAQEQGLNPAELVYKLAQRRGYQRGQAKQSSAQDLTRVDNGQRQNKSLSSGGGRPSGTGDLTMGKVAELKGAAFDQAFAKLRESSRRSA